MGARATSGFNKLSFRGKFLLIATVGTAFIAAMMQLVITRVHF
jgi:hypothetical protein